MGCYRNSYLTVNEINQVHKIYDPEQIKLTLLKTPFLAVFPLIIEDFKITIISRSRQLIFMFFAPNYCGTRQHAYKQIKICTV